MCVSTALEISDPVYPESLHYSWAAEHFKPQSPEQIRNLSRSALLYSIVRHSFERQHSFV